MIKGRKSKPQNIVAGGQAEPLRVVLQLIDVEKVSNINIVSQTFHATVFVELRIDGGALDQDLVRKDQAVRKADDGSLHPSAMWYLNKLEVGNAVKYELENARVLESGDDLILSVKVIGVFEEPMELENFPIDIQELTVKLRFGCRMDGALPVEFALDGQERAFVESYGVGMIQHEYDVGDKLHIETRIEGQPGRQFPWLNFAVMVKRKPNYAMWNVVVPSFVFAMTASLQFFIPLEDQGARLETSLTLLLTAAAYKVSIASVMPDISYLTLVDIYVLICGAFIAFIVVEGAVMGKFYLDHPEQREFVLRLDHWIGKALLSCFVVVHAFYAYYICTIDRRRRDTKKAYVKLPASVHDESVDASM